MTGLVLFLSSLQLKKLHPEQGRGKVYSLTAYEERLCLCFEVVFDEHAGREACRVHVIREGRFLRTGLSRNSTGFWACCCRITFFSVVCVGLCFSIGPCYLIQLCRHTMYNYLEVHV